MEIAPGVHCIHTLFGDRFVCLYLLGGSEAALLVDIDVNERLVQTGRRDDSLTYRLK